MANSETWRASYEADARAAGLDRSPEYFARLRANASALKAAGYVGRAVPLNPHS